MTTSLFYNFAEFNTMQNIFVCFRAIMDKLTGFQNDGIMVIMMITTYPNTV